MWQLGGNLEKVPFPHYVYLHLSKQPCKTLILLD